MVKFTENFWGEKCLGFDVLYHNMKYGQKSCNEFIDFVKERMLVEETYSKQLGKLSRQVANNPALGSFSPYWHVLKQSTERDSNLHQTMLLRLQDLLKDMQKYLEEQTRKHKTMKDAETETSNVVQSIQNLTTTLHKSKEAYLARSQELEKCRKDSAGTSTRDIERAEARVKKAAEDYRTNVDKYSAMRVDFERKMMNSSQHFQDLEEQHLQQMLEFAHTYTRVIEYCWQTMGEVYSELKNQTSDLTIDKLLTLFVDSKGTGTEKPAAIEFEDAPSLITPPPPTNNNLLIFDGDDHNLNIPTPIIAPPIVEEPPKKREGFLRPRKDKDVSKKDTKKETKKETSKDSKKKKSKDRETTSTPTIAEDAKSESSFGSQSHEAGVQPQPLLDAEGFTIRPTDGLEEKKPRSDSYEQYKQSSSDTDSDNDGPKKLHVVIKPPTIQANHTGPTGDELRAQARNLMLGSMGHSYTGGKRATTKMQEMMKRSTSVSSNMLDNKINVLDPMAPPPVPPAPWNSSETSWTQSNYPIPPQRTGGSLASNPWDSSPDFSLLSQSVPQSSVPPGSSGFPAVPLRSVSFATNKFPLTTGASSVVAVPLAVAFVEKVSANFVGADESRCRVRIEGDVILTFPSGVLQTLLANPNHPALSFCLMQTGMLESILPNKHLVTQETQIDDGRITYTFNMLNLTNQLKKQVEAKAVPQPYQNIPVIKYQVLSSSGVQNAPVLLVSYWKQEDRTTDMRIDYRRNASFPPLRGCQINVPVKSDIKVSSMTSLPTGDWSPVDHMARWNIIDPPTELANIKARFEHPTESRGQVAGQVQCSFQTEGFLLSRVLFELASEGYKVTVVKMRVASSKYVCDAADDSVSFSSSK